MKIFFLLGVYIDKILVHHIVHGIGGCVHGTDLATHQKYWSDWLFAASRIKHLGLMSTCTRNNTQLHWHSHRMKNRKFVHTMRECVNFSSLNANFDQEIRHYYNTHAAIREGSQPLFERGYSLLVDWRMYLCRYVRTQIIACVELLRWQSIHFRPSGRVWEMTAAVDGIRVMDYLPHALQIASRNSCKSCMKRWVFASNGFSTFIRQGFHAFGNYVFQIGILRGCLLCCFML